MLFALEDVADAVGAISNVCSAARTCNNAQGFLRLGPSGAGWKHREMHTQERMPSKGRCHTFMTSQKRHALCSLPELPSGIELHLSITPLQHAADWFLSLPCLTSPLLYQCFLGLLPK